MPMNSQEHISSFLGKLTPEYIGERVVPGALNILLILILTFILLRLAKLILARMHVALLRHGGDVEFQKRANTLGSVVRYLLNITIISMAVIMILGELRINIAPVLATAGIVGLAIGFGAQSLVQDVISGFFILLHDQIRVGDVVEIAGKSGLVEKVDLRMTVLRDTSGNVHYVRHGKIDVITNMTKDFSHFVFDIPVAYGENVDKVMEVIKNIDEEMRQDPGFREDIIAPMEMMGIDRFSESAIIIRARTTTQPIKQWGVAREFNRRLKIAFDTQKIEMPLNQLTIYIGRDKKGNPPVVRVAGEGAGREDGAA
jgi:small-conductance mechanosensitive channel